MAKSRTSTTVAELEKLEESKDWDTLLTEIISKNDLEGRPTSISQLFQSIQSHFARLNKKRHITTLTNTQVKSHLDRNVMSGHLIRYLCKKKMVYKVAQNSDRVLQFELNKFMLNSQEKNEDLIGEALLKIMIELSQGVGGKVKDAQLQDHWEYINSTLDGLTINQMTEYIHYSHHILFSNLNLKDKPDTQDTNTNSSKIKRVFLQSLIYSVLQKETTSGGENEKYIKCGFLYKLNPLFVPKEKVSVEVEPKPAIVDEKIDIKSPTKSKSTINNNNKNEIDSSSSRKVLQKYSNNQRRKRPAPAPTTTTSDIDTDIDMTMMQDKNKIVKLAFDQNSASIIVNPNPSSIIQQFEYSEDGCNRIFYDPVNPKDKTMMFPIDHDLRAIGPQSGTFLQLGKVLKQNPQSCDAELIVGNEVFKVHKLVLASQSNYFYNLFKDKIDGVPFLLDSAISNVEVFLLTLNFFYYGNFGEVPVCLDPDSICEFLYLADKFEISRLTEYCLETVKRLINPDKVDPDFYTRLLELMFDKRPVTQSFLTSIINIVKPSYRRNRNRSKMNIKKWEKFFSDPDYEEIAQILNS